MGPSSNTKKVILLLTHRFLARKCGLAGKSEEEEARADMVAELAWDLVESENDSPKPEVLNLYGAVTHQVLREQQCLLFLPNPPTLPKKLCNQLLGHEP